MKTQSVEDHILSLLNDTFPDRSCRTITRNTDLTRDLGADSMTMVSLMFSIDEKFHVGTDQLGDLIVNCHTVGDLVTATERLQHERAHRAPIGTRAALGRART
jgi:acyl carrier protein